MQSTPNPPALARSRRHSPVLLPRVALPSLLVLALLPLACKSKPAPPTESSASATSAAGAEPAPRCREASPGAAFLLGKPSAKPAEAEQVADLPFAIELGRAEAIDSGFLITALRSVGNETHAVLASVTEDASGGRLLELGRVHGDVDPPNVAARGGRVVVGVVDHDATSTIVRLASVTQPSTAPNLTWGGLPQIGSDESQAFDLALGEQRGVLVWDDFKKQDGHGTVWSLTFGLDDPSSLTPARVVSPKGVDVEAPKLIPRPGGYWLAWIAHAKTTKAKSDAPAKIDLESLVELGARYIQLARLDENGVRVGDPIDVTERTGHVLVFDLAPGPDGSAWLAWRDDATSPGVERQSVWLARVDVAGARTELVVEDERVGAGVPRLFSVASPKRAAWLSLNTVGDRTTLAALGAEFKLIEQLGAEPLLGSAEILAAKADRVLLGKPQGLAAELSVLVCDPGPPPVPSASASEGAVVPPPNEEAPGDVEPPLQAPE